MTAGSSLDLFSTFVQLHADGRARSLPVTADFWRKLVISDEERLIGAKHALTPSDFHADQCEMHPRADEFLFLVKGEIDVVFEEADGDTVRTLRGGDACIVPRGTWHRLVLREPSDLLFVTPPSGTQLRPRRAAHVSRP